MQNSFMTCFELHILIFFDTPVLMLYIAACIHCVLIDFSYYTHWRHSYCFSVDLIDFHTPDNGEVSIHVGCLGTSNKYVAVPRHDSICTAHLQHPYSDDDACVSFDTYAFS